MKPLKVMLTGGPGGGKSSALATLKSMLLKRGYSVFIIPENGTRLLDAIGGFDPSWRKRESLIRMQRIFLDFQRAQEEAIISLAEMKEENTIVLLDRGIKDGKLFMDDLSWNEVTGISEDDINRECQERYDIVLHMTSVAVDRPELYEFGPGSNNPARFHTAAEAKENDLRAKECYKNHNRTVIVRTSESFQDKMSCVLHHIEEICHEFFGSGLKFTASSREKLRVGPLAWSKIVKNIHFRTRQFTSLVFQENQTSSMRATMKLIDPSHLNKSFAVNDFQVVPGVKCISSEIFYEKRYQQERGNRISRSQLTEREFLSEMKACNSADPRILFKKQICWSDSNGFYFTVTEFLPTSTQGSSESYFVLDKPSQCDFPSWLCRVFNKKRPLQAVNTLDACDLITQKSRNS
jgi:predicted ATPase